MRIKKIILIVLVIVVLFLGWMLMVDITKERAYRQNANNIFDLNKPSGLIEQTKPVSQEVIDRLSATLTKPYSIKDSKIYYQDTIIGGVDIATFEMLRSGYARDIHAMYYANKSISSADLATFRVIGDGYAEDKNQLY